MFIIGSPRCGTSELAETLATHLGLAWTGEGQNSLAPALAAGASALTLSADLTDELAVAMAAESLPMVIRAAARRIYYRAHRSASFVDKTPSEAMIRAAPFLSWCFPRARFVFMHRNGIANVLSRIRKFGGDFSDHCRDWTACMEAWEGARSELPHFLEVAQEEMAADPTRVAGAVAEYLSASGAAEAIAESLRSGSRGRTGAGLGKDSFADTDWSDFEIARFKTYCGAAMARWGHPID